MDRPEFQSLIEENLRRAAARFAAFPRLAPLDESPWVAMSLLQKAIRRGRSKLALSAAATLLRDAPERLWRRLGVIACEDVGLGDLDAVGVAIAATGGVRTRAERGGDWPVACAVVDALAHAPKCRAADDLLMVCERHPRSARRREALRGASLTGLLAIVSGAAGIDERALALWLALGGGPRHLGLRRPRHETEAAFDRLGEVWPGASLEIARLSFRRSGELLGPLLGLLAREPMDWSRIEGDEFPPEAMIGETPGWAFDLYTREGRAVYARFLETDAPAAQWLRRYVPRARRVAVFGHCAFRVEGGLVDRRLRWGLADRLREEVDAWCAGPGGGDVSELLALVRRDMTRLNDLRAQLRPAAIRR